METQSFHEINTYLFYLGLDRQQHDFPEIAHKNIIFYRFTSLSIFISEQALCDMTWYENWHMNYYK